MLNVWLFDSVPSESSSSVKLAGDRPPPAVNEKSCGSSGVASFTTVIEPVFWLVNVHVTTSAGATLMFEIGLPSLQVALDCAHPEGTDSARE